ncbi:MAG: ABC transporter substrate-binding protein [Granulosicoccus sp.]|nr:ABC transporter substrate-binding protein [Granulosicoccus sp.]
MKQLRRLSYVFIMLFLCASATPVLSEELEVTHWWTSGGEVEAVKVLAEAFNRGGDTWVDSALAGSDGTARSVIISRILGGDPMGATQLNHGRQAEELIAEGLMLDLTELAEKERWRDFIRPVKLLDSCTYDGRVYCVPINIHSFQWMWVSLDAYRNAGMDAPEDWYEFVASAPRLRSVGIAPLAIGGQSWQVSGLFGALKASLGGAQLWHEVIVERDSNALRGQRMAEIWRAFGDARSLQKENNTIQNWNDATNQLILGQSAVQVMGDWAQSEFSLARLTAGQHYDCLPGLGVAPVLDTGGDSIYFPKMEDASKTQAQYRLASTLLSKDVQLAFNLAKGSLPVRSDIDLTAANECMKKGFKVLENPRNILPSVNQYFDPDTLGQLEDLIIEFWADPESAPEAIHDKWASIIEQSD